ncbi:sigma-70 region 4 domain-containing protein, partial [Nocardioides sp.]|uniref:sigma-70 region 4 domain-containing protein n=1 Tax=Nocardioides sp. TaxID=35761 RepID=UPI002733C3D3
LPTDQRVAIVLRFYEQLSYAEIAALTDCAEPTAVAGPRRAGWLSRPQRAWLPFR